METQKERTPEERTLWLIGLKIQNEVRDFIFETLTEINGYDHGVRFTNSHVEIHIGISANLFREEIVTVLYPEDDPRAVIELMKDQLQEIYKKLINS